MMANARDIARVFAYLSQQEENNPIEKTRLLKLLYFAQGHTLSELGRPLFQNKIDAWEYGPVVSVVYKNYAKIKKDAREYGLADVRVSPEEMEIVLDVWEKYKKFKAGDLVEMTHRDGTPWKETYIEGKKDTHISNDLIERFFSRPENRLKRALNLVNGLPTVDALPASEYDPNEDSVWEALLNDGE